MIALPATPDTVLREVVTPALALLPEKMRTPRAQVMLLAIGLQESGLAARVQSGNGPARGLWQFELGGVRGVCTHPASAPYVPTIAGLCGLATTATPAQIYTALEHDDTLAAIVARLLLYTLPQPLPVLGDADDGWRQYALAWRPGKPRPLTWSRNYQTALEALP